MSYFSVLVGAAATVALGTALSAPISMMHAITGALVGVALFSRGWNAVSWDIVARVALSWLLSPALGGLLSVLCRYALKRAGRSHASYKVAIPLISGVATCATVAVVALSAPRWLLRRWFPEVHWALLALLFLFAVVSSATAGFVHRNTGTSVVNYAIYNIAEEDDESVDSSRDGVLERGEDDSLDRNDAISGRSLTPDGPAEVAVLDADMYGNAEDADFEIGDSREDDDWVGGAFVLDERAPVFQLLLVGTTAGIAFAHGSTDVPLVMSPFAGMLRALGGQSSADTRDGESVSSDATAVFSPTLRQGAETVLEPASVHPVVLVAAAITIVAGLVFCGGRVIATMGAVNKRSKLSFARSFSVQLSAVLAVLAAKCLRLPVSISYSVVASHAVSSVAYVTSHERALERVQEGLDVRLLTQMAVLAALAPCVSAALAVTLRLVVGWVVR